MGKWLLAAILAVLSVQTMAMVGTTSEKRGYWWYMETPKEEPTEEETKPERQELPPLPSRAELMDMHPDDLSEMQEKYQKQAVWRPTPEHVRDYYIVQDVIRRKAVAYMAVTGLVMLQNPDLNVAKEYPITGPGRKAVTRVRKQTLGNALQGYRKKYALIMFSKRGCEYCVVQQQALKLFQDRHGWVIKEVDIERSPQAGQRFGVEFTPMTILIERGSKNWMPVAVGVESVPVIEENIYRGIRLLRGDTAPEQFYTLEYEEGGTFDPTAELGGYQ